MSRLDLAAKRFQAALESLENAGVAVGENLDAADEFRKWVYAGGRKLPGLIIRRMAERGRFLE